MSKTLLFLISVVFFSSNLLSQIVINEVCSKNIDLTADSYGRFTDWIELYNTSASTVNLSDYFISDNANNPTKSRLPELMMDSGAYLILFSTVQPDINEPLHFNFKLNSDGCNLYLFNKKLELVQKLEVPALWANHSYARIAASEFDYAFFTDPTPGITNSSTYYSGYCKKPQAKLAAGFYTGSKSVEIESIDHAIVNYTLNGKEPGYSDTRYRTPIVINSSTVVKLKSFEDGKIPSKTLVLTYIINEYKDLAMISISTDPDNLWDEKTGIYNLGPNAQPEYPFYGANFWRDTAIEVDLEYFDDEHIRSLSGKFEMQIYGGKSSRTQAQKALRFKPVKENTTDINNFFFEDKKLATIKRFIINNAASDFNKSQMRDGFIHEIVISNALKVDALAYKPVVVYINGEYWGIQNLREKFDKQYLESNFEINDDSIDILEDDSIVTEGNFDRFNAMIDYAKENDLSQDDKFESMKEWLDIENFTDYFITETYFNNFDWPAKNVICWQSKHLNGKFRYVLYGLDETLNNKSWSAENNDLLAAIFNPEYNSNRHVALLNSLLNNHDYKIFFINRYADLINSAYSSVSITKQFNKTVNAIEAEMPFHFEKWDGDISTWYTELDKIRQFIQNRPQYALNYLKQAFDLEGSFILNMKTSDGFENAIQINTIQPDSIDWEGIYFLNVPISLEIKNAATPAFSYWEVENTGAIIYESTISRAFVENTSIIAHFRSENDLLSIYPNPVHQTIHISLSLKRDADLSLNIYNAEGKKVVNAFLGNYSVGFHEIKYNLPYGYKGVYFMQLFSDSKIDETKKILVY